MTDGAPGSTNEQSVVASSDHHAGDSHDDIVMNGGNACQDDAAIDVNNDDVLSDNLTEQSPPPPPVKNENNNVDFEEEEEQEEPETQESFTQHEMTQTGNDLTQMGLFDDDDDDGNDCNDDDDDGNSRQPMIDPLTLPWGRLMPVGSNGVALPAASAIGGGEHTSAVASTSSATAAATSSLRPSTREAIEMLPRPPESRTITRNRSPSLDNGRLSSGGAKSDDNDDGNSQNEDGLTFLGLKNLIPSDRFNEYVLGRSAKADITAQKLDNPVPINADNLTEQQKQQEEKKRKSHDYIHAMISNRHCRMYCLLNLPNQPNNTIISNNNNKNHPPEMEVFVEDTSGNGTLINGTTLLRKNERRKLHTGDVICLLNPKLLYKKIRNGNERKRYMQQYSYVFVNLYEQERHWNYNYSSSQSLCGVGGGGGGVGSPVSFLSSRKSHGNGNSNISNGKSAAVNPRATRCHTKNVGNSDDLTRTNVSGQSSSDAATATATTSAKGGGPPAMTRKPSLGSFLNNQSSSSRRRVEDEYDLRDLLGTGTCGEVRRAIHRRTGDERAVKIISITERGMGGANFFSKEKLSAIQAEAEILRSLDHPYVVKLFDVFVAPGKAIYLVMELIRGGDLFDRIVERERYTEVHARRLFRRILSAVHYLHEQRGVVHRDLKPENILVVDRRSDVDIKLTDFGLAKNLTAEGLKTFCGTPQYFAPEVLRRRNTVMGNGRYGKEIDCWSIGVILFILLSGSPPFDVSAGFDAVASAKVVFYEDQWKDVSSEARDLVRRLLEKDAKKRMSVKEACEHAWVLVDDGDTHCHPLRDPVVTPVLAAAISTELKPPVESNEKDKAISDAKAMPAPPPQPKQSPKMAVKESPKPASKNRAQKTFLSKSAPQLSKIEHNRNFDSKHPRNLSLLPLCDETSVTKKIFQQVMYVPEQKCQSSPISAKFLFAQAPNEGSGRKMSKHDVESIKTAGNTLPKPTLSAGSRLLPKKKIQQQLGANFKKAGPSKPKAPKEAAKPASQSSSDKENDTSEKKRKLSSSTVTPPGEEHTLVFRLNKKRKTGKHVAAEDQEDAKNAVTESSQKAELSEDELMSDFSDDEGGEQISKPTKKRKIDAFLHKRPSESIQSAASIQSLDSKGTKSSSARISLSPNLDKQAPGTVQIETKNEVKVAPSISKRGKTTGLPPKSKKKKQTFLFGKPPPNGLDSTMEVESSSVVDDADTGAMGSELNPPIQEEGEEIIELERQSSNESLAGQATNSTKGKQKSIKSWFLPKT